MTGTTLAALIRYKTKTNSVTLTDADMLPLVNVFKNEISSRISERNEKIFLIPSTDNLVADQRHYAIPDDMLNRIHKVEIKFTATTSRFPARAIKDYYGSETESEIVKNFTNAEGGFFYTIRRRALFILSGTIIAVTGGLRMWYNLFPADLANLTGSTDLAIDPTTTSHGFPKQFHELLARRISIEYKGSQPKPIPLNQKELTYEQDLEVQLNAIAYQDNSLEIIGELPDSKDMGNDGWDY